MGVPKDIESLLFDELVVWVIDHCLLKRRVACVHNKENDSTREDVGLPSVVMLQRDLRSHVSLSPQLRMQDPSAVMSSDQAGEPEICNLEYEVRTQQHILRLDIPMRISLLMHIVDAIHHLMEVRPRNPLCKFTSFRNIIEQLPSTRILQYNRKAAESRLIGFLIQRLLLNRNQLDQILMIEHLHYIEFLLQRLEGRSLMLVLFDGY